jgi:X-X-X-Leu-X-X-Gly heptad repeat protein
MSPEEIERTVQFLLHQQAKFAADFEKFSLRTDQITASLSVKIDQLAEGLVKLSVKTDRLADGLVGLTSIVGQLAAAQQRTDEQLRETIRTFERHLRENHGRPPA